MVWLSIRGTKRSLWSHWIFASRHTVGGEAFDNITRFKPVDLEEFEEFVRNLKFTKFLTHLKMTNHLK